MRLLLIHDADEMRSHIAQQIVAGIPDIELTFWDPSRQDMPQADYCKAFDVVMLDEHPGDDEGIDYLTAWQRRGDGMPPTLFLVGADSMARTEAVRIAGAASCVVKLAISPASVASTLRSVAQQRRPLHTTAGHTTAGDTVPDSKQATTNAAAPLRIAGYQILRRIGSGDRVYLARRESDGLAVVIKTLAPACHQDLVFRQRCIEEYRILRRVTNDHVALIYDAALNERQGYIVMEYYPAGDLTARIGKTGLAPDVAMLYLAQIARGLEAAHGAGVIHRNLKPQNILLRNDMQVALADFGLTPAFVDHTAVISGESAEASPVYMSPEQCAGAQHDVRGDLYSLGTVFFHMLTGRPPYGADNAGDLAFQHLHGALPRLPAALSAYQPLIDRLLAKRPEHRPRSATALLAAIKQ
jgi:eukaryotic-like serine/threonine-protein kinase